MTPPTLFAARAVGPDGPVLVAFGERGVRAVCRGDDAAAHARLEQEVGRPLSWRNAVPDAIAEALRQSDGSCLDYDLGELTPFQRAVLQATLDIPRGETASYSELARRVGRPGAARAVGNAMRRNPVPYLIPCHRVVREDRSLGNYSAGGPERKRVLLLAEGAIV